MNNIKFNKDEMVSFIHYVSDDYLEDTIKFIRDNYNLLDNNRFDTFYINYHDRTIYDNVNLLTAILLLSNIDVLNNISFLKYKFFGFLPITSIEIPNSVSKINPWIFYRCDNLVEINFKFDFNDLNNKLTLKQKFDNLNFNSVYDILLKYFGLDVHGYQHDVKIMFNGRELKEIIE